jgi:phosphate:Na+ symporter
MTADLMRLAGGLGLFLLGMVVMTEGLRALAGDALNRVLFRFTRSPYSGAAFGAVVTAVVQSSSATTVATVGFVSAGLLSFPQALGVLFGANIGTTITGWLVALIGFKLSVGTAMLPVLLLGLLMRLFGRRRVRHVGWALAGFALIFFGIEQLRAGMAPFQGIVTPAVFPGDTLSGRLLLVLLGVGITLVTQSSSAGVAMALTAVNAGAIEFSQASVLVIGMNVGTTANTALATIGGSQQTKRTGFAHVIFNLLTGVGALILLPFYARGADLWLGSATTASPELALVGFHTMFNTLGVVLVLPLTGAFARLMYRLFPDQGPNLTERLELRLLEDPSAASLAVWRTVRGLTSAVFGAAVAQLEAPRGRLSFSLEELEGAVDETRRYADQVRPVEASQPAKYRVAALHCLDHLDRLINRCRQAERARSVRADPRLAGLGAQLATALWDVSAAIETDAAEIPAAAVKAARDALRHERQPYRRKTLEGVGSEQHLDAAIAKLDAVRWLHRTAYHAWRIAHNLHTAEESPGEEIPARAELDPSETEDI